VGRRAGLAGRAAGGHGPLAGPGHGPHRRPYPGRLRAGPSDPPDLEILRATGFEIASAQTYRHPHEWTPESIAGYLASTSVLSAAALGELGPAFDADLRRELAPWSAPGGLRQEVRFECELASRPLAGASV
jgi:hypothetical protein